MSLPFNITNPGWNISSLLTSQEAAYVTDLVLASAGASENDVLTWKSGAPSWEVPVGGFSDPLTTNGDIIARVGGTTTRLAQGGNGTFLGVSGGTLGYYSPAGSGDVVGPASAVDSNFASFNTTTGKLIKDSGSKAADFVLKSGSTMSGNLNITRGSYGPNSFFTNTDSTQYAGSGFTLFSNMSSLGNNAGVHFATNITDVSATQANFAIDKVNYSGAYVSNLMVINLTTNATTFGGALSASNLSGTNTGDNAVNSNYSGLVTNATHTGEVTGSGALTVDKTAITGKTAVTAVGADYVLISDTSDSGNLKKALVSDFGTGSVEGTAVLSTGETGGVKFLREDGDGTSSWQTIAGGGNVSKVGTPVDNQIGVWTGDGTIEGDAGFTFDGGLGITVSDTENKVGLTITQNDTTNDPYAIRIVSPNGSTGMLIESTSTGSSGLFTRYYHNSASPAAGDSIGGEDFIGKTSTGVDNYYAWFNAYILDTTNGSEYGYFVMNTCNSGVNSDMLIVGAKQNSSGTAAYINGIGVGEYSFTSGAYVSSNGSQPLILKTGNATTGSITIDDGAGTDITIAPEGGGDVRVHGDTLTGEEPTLILHHPNNSYAGNPSGYIKFNALNSTSAQVTYAQVFSEINVTTASSESSSLKFGTMTTGSLTTKLEVGAENSSQINGISIGNSSAAGVLSSRGDHDLILQTGNATTGNITIVDGTSGDIQINPNGTGALVLMGSNGKIKIDSGVPGVLTTSSNQDIKLTTYDGTNSGIIEIKNGTNGNINLTPNGTGAVAVSTTIELGHASDTTISRVSAGVIAVEGVTVPTISSTNTLTNKRVNPRTASSTTAATLTPDLSSANVYFRTTQTEALTIGAPTGTPVIGETLLIYVDSAGAQTLTMNATYKAFGAAFPAATTAGKTLMISCQYNGTDWKTLWANAV